MCLCFFFALHVTANAWNVSTQRDFLAYLGDDDLNNPYLTIFTLSTPISIFGAPIMDFAILRHGWIVSLQCVNVLAVSVSLIKVLSTNLNVQVVGFVFFSFFRNFLSVFRSVFFQTL